MSPDVICQAPKHISTGVLMDSLSPYGTLVLEMGPGFPESCEYGRGREPGVRKLVAKGFAQDPKKHGWDFGNWKHLASVACISTKGQLHQGPTNHLHNCTP